MPGTVIDSSVIVKWVTPEPDSPLADAIVIEAARTGENLIVLDLALAEAANAIWKRQYRGLATLDEARRALGDLLACRLQVESAQRLLPQALEIAAKYRRAVYDALFVALADDLRLTGVTADEPLYNAVHADFPKIVLLRNWQP